MPIKRKRDKHKNQNNRPTELLALAQILLYQDIVRMSLRRIIRFNRRRIVPIETRERISVYALKLRNTKMSFPPLYNLDLGEVDGQNFF